MLCPILWIGWLIIAIIAANKLDYLFYNDSDLADYSLKRNNWGSSFISYKDAKNIYEKTNDKIVKAKSKEAVKLWKMSYACLFSAIVLFIVILLIQ